MTEDEARAAWTGILDMLGISPGDVLYIGVDMGRVPLPAYPAALTRDGIRERQEKWCGFLLSVLMERLGSDGTLLVPTFTYSYGAKGQAYVHEASPSETGPFTEYVRTRPGAVRSLHPLHSVTGLGRGAREICDGVPGKAAYGALSIFARLAAFPTRFAGFGVTLSKVVTYVHHMEQMYGVNHRYNKVFDTPVIVDSHERPGPWLCNLRYLGTPIRANLDAIVAELREDGALRELRDESRPMQSVTLRDLERVGYAMLARSPWAFAREPVEIQMGTSGGGPIPSPRRTICFLPNPEEC